MVFEITNVTNSLILIDGLHLEPHKKHLLPESAITQDVRDLYDKGYLVSNPSLKTMDNTLGNLDDTDDTPPVDNQFLQFKLSQKKWVPVTVSAGGGSPLAAKGDIYGYGTADARLPVGTDGQTLVADSVQALGVKWVTPVAGDPSPLTAKGQLYSFSTVDAALAVGTDGQVLVADSIEVTGLKWVDKVALGTVVESPNYTVLTLPAGNPGDQIFVTDATPVPTPAFHDGTDWRSLIDGNIIA